MKMTYCKRLSDQSLNTWGGGGVGVRINSNFYKLSGPPTLKKSNLESPPFKTLSSFKTNPLSPIPSYFKQGQSDMADFIVIQTRFLVYGKLFITYQLIIFFVHKPELWSSLKAISRGDI